MVGAGVIGLARSDSGGDGSPHRGMGGAAPVSDTHSGEPLMHDRPMSTDADAIAALGAGPAAMNNPRNNGIHRGPSNASSAYSGGQRSEASGDGPLPNNMSSPQYYDEGGPYGSPPAEGGWVSQAQPIIRDVPARRNTRIESPTVFPQQGSAGISQNF
jgi:hypothetical protein